MTTETKNDKKNCDHKGSSPFGTRCINTSRVCGGECVRVWTGHSSLCCPLNDTLNDLLTSRVFEHGRERGNLGARVDPQIEWACQSIWSLLLLLLLLCSSHGWIHKTLLPCGLCVCWILTKRGDWRDENKRIVHEDVSIPSVYAHGRRSVYGLSWGPLSSNIDGMDAVKSGQQLHMDLA